VNTSVAQVFGGGSEFVSMNHRKMKKVIDVFHSLIFHMGSKVTMGKQIFA
jgi:hypothetical protein